MTPVKWGVLSTANIAIKKVIPGMIGAPMSDVTAIASRDLSTAQRVADGLDIDRAYGSYEELLDDDEIEAVYIPLPNNLHAEWTLAAAAAGKHVLCEKPIAMTSTDAQRMISACEAAGVKLMEAFMYRLHPLWVEVRRLVDTGAIGKLTAIDTVFTYFNDDPGNIRNIRESGGGALFDIGCYPINLARMLFGAEPEEVKASVRVDPTSGVDVVTSAILEFADGVATFLCSTRMEPDQRVLILGTEGRLVIEIPFNIPPDRSSRFLEISGGEPPHAPDTTIHEISAVDAYGVQADAFSHAIRTDSPVPIPPQDSVANLEVIETIFAISGS